MADEEPPPGYEEETSAPPGFEEVDQPDLALKTPGLEKPDVKLHVEFAEGVVPPDADLYKAEQTWEELGLSQELLDGIYQEMKFTRPSQIQARTLPLILKPPYTAMIAQGHNGSGKTVCFAVAMLSRVSASEAVPQALCMCPTRELVVQNLAVIRQLGKHTGITSIGTDEFAPGRRQPPINQQIVIGTAGRLQRVVGERKLVLNDIRVLVFDEADEMMKVDGFKDASVRLIAEVRNCTESLQILLFSATYDEEVKAYCKKVIPATHRVFIEKEALSLDVIKQYKVRVSGRYQKDQILKDYIFKNADRLGQTIIFVAMRRTAQELFEMLKGESYDCLKLAGDMEPEARDDVVRQFRAVQAKVLIATDVIARGFDVSTVTLVINYDLPVEYRTGAPAYETYLHRIGRSGRFGRKGAAFNFMDMDFAPRWRASDEEVMDAMSQYFKKEIPEVPADDEEAFIQVLEEAGLIGDDGEQEQV